MNVLFPLLLPWRTVHRSLRWLGGGFGLLLCLAGAGVAAQVGGAHGWRYGMMLYAFGAGYFWMCVMACLLLVAIDARRQRLPGIERSIAGSVLLYGLLSAGLPLALVLPMGGDAATIALVAALAAATGLASPLLPRYFTMALGFLPALALGARHRLAIPFPGQPGFVPLGLAVLVALAVACLLRWRYLLRAEAPAETGLGSAMVLQYRRNGGMGGGLWGAAMRDDTTTAGARTATATPSIRLHGVGPRTPVLALRVALGEQLAPQSLRSHARRFARLGLPLLLFIPLMAFMQSGEAHGDVARKLWLGVGISVIGWLGLMGGMALMVMGCLPLRARWGRTNAELPLLALLPGLGHGDALRRHLLRAALVRPLALQALLLALVLGAALAMRAGPALWLFAALGQLGCAGVVVASTLATFGGKPLPGWGMGVVLAAMGLLVSTSTFLSLFAGLGPHAHALSAASLATLAMLWAVAIVALLWLGRRGWRGMQTQPHPFLAP